MDWDDTPAQATFRSEARAFIAEHLPEYYRRKAEQEPKSGFDAGQGWMADRKSTDEERRKAAEQWTQALADRHWLAPHWPAEYGGSGLSVWEMTILNQELGKAGAPAVGSQGVTQLGPAIIIHGNEEQKQKYLQAIQRGEIAWCQGYSEPGAGSDLASLQTRALRDGDEYVVNGQKIWTTGAHRADALYMLVRTDPNAPKHRGISFLILDSVDTPGVTVRPLITMNWEHDVNEVFFEDVRVPVANRVGEENRGWYVAVTLLDYERATIDGAVRDREAILRLINFSKTAQGAPMSRISESPVVRADLAWFYIRTVVAENLSMRVASMQAAGTLPNYESSIQKLFGTETHRELQFVGTRAFGLYSNLWDGQSTYAPVRCEFTHAYVGSIPSTFAGGSSEIQKNIIATRGLGLPRG